MYRDTNDITVMRVTIIDVSNDAECFQNSLLTTGGKMLRILSSITCAAHTSQPANERNNIPLVPDYSRKSRRVRHLPFRNSSDCLLQYISIVCRVVTVMALAKHSYPFQLGLSFLTKISMSWTNVFPQPCILIQMLCEIMYGEIATKNSRNIPTTRFNWCTLQCQNRRWRN